MSGIEAPDVIIGNIGGGGGAGITLSSQKVSVGSTFTTTSLSYVDITGLSLTLPNRAGGSSSLTAFLDTSIGTASNTAHFVFVDNSIQQDQRQIDFTNSGIVIPITFFHNTTLSGQIIKIQTASNGTVTISIYGTVQNTAVSTLHSVEISSP